MTESLPCHGHTLRRRSTQRLSALALAALVMAGCGSEAAVEATRTLAPTAIPAPVGVDGEGNVLTLEVVAGGPVPDVLTDHRGFAVYGNSTETPDALVCVEDECTDAWIPLAPQADGLLSPKLDADAYEVLTRPDGSEQVVYLGVALYLWSGDREIGIPAGSGVAGTWFGMTADGTQITG